MEKALSPDLELAQQYLKLLKSSQSPTVNGNHNAFQNVVLAIMQPLRATHKLPELDIMISVVIFVSQSLLNIVRKAQLRKQAEDMLRKQHSAQQTMAMEAQVLHQAENVSQYA